MKYCPLPPALLLLPLAVVAVWLARDAFGQAQGSLPGTPPQFRWQDPQVWMSPPVSYWVSPIPDQTTPVLTVPIGKKFLLRRTDTDVTEGPLPLIGELLRVGGTISSAFRLGSNGQVERSSLTLGGTVVRAAQTLGLGLVIDEGETLQIRDPDPVNTPMGNWVFTGEWIPATLPIHSTFASVGGLGQFAEVLKVNNPSGLILAAYGSSTAGGSGISCRFQVKDDQNVVRLELPPIYEFLDLQMERSWLFLESGWSIEAMPTTSGANSEVWFTVIDL